MKNFKLLLFSKSKFTVTIFGFLLLVGCKPLKDAGNTQPPITLPETFSEKNDSANLAQVKWQTFFEDENLKALIDIGLKNNLDLLKLSQRMAAANAQFKQNKNMLLPSVDAFVNAGQTKFGKYTMDGVGNFDTNFSPNIEEDQKMKVHLPDFHAGLQMSWEIDIWGKLSNRKKSAYAKFLASKEGRNLLLTNLIADIAMTYYELLALDNELNIIQETNVLLQNALDLITLQKQAGEANALAVEQFEAQLLNSKTLETEISQQQTECENKLNFLLGRFPQPIQRDRNALIKPSTWKKNTGIPSQLLKNRPDIRQAEFELIASKANVKAAKAAFYPSLTIGGHAGFQSFNAALWILYPQSLAYNVLGGLAAPLLNRNQIKAAYRISKADQAEAVYQYQYAIINGFVEVNNQLASINNMDKALEFKSKEAEILTRSIETSTSLFRSGRASYLEVLMAQKNALNAKLELVNVKQKQLNAFVNMYKALGGGWQ
jgi:outer membrane protein, multidrug efflux system